MRGVLRDEANPPAGNTWREVELSLPSEFWAQFAEHTWGQRPAVFKGIIDVPPLTPEEVFRGLFNLGEQYRGIPGIHRVRFYIEQAMQRADIGTYLPDAADGSMDGYRERISRKLEGRKFGLVVNDFHRYDARLYTRLRDFLRGLYEFVDVPSNLVDVALFLGNYKNTPFGLHYDTLGSNNFTFVLSGRKRLLTWPYEFFVDHHKVSASLDYEPYRDQARVLEGAPGDLMFWPSHYWHVAELGDSFPITISVGHERGPHTSLVDPFRMVGRLLDERLGASEGAKYYSYRLSRQRRNTNRFPQFLASTARVLKDLSSDRQLQRMLRVSWLNRVTGFGFETVPAPLPLEPLADHRLVCGDPRYPVMWLPAEDDEVVCSANGHAFSLTAHPRVLRMLARLNRGEAVAVGTLVDKYQGTAKKGRVVFEATASDIRAVLEKLYSLRAIVPVPSRQARTSELTASSQGTSPDTIHPGT